MNAYYCALHTSNQNMDMDMSQTKYLTPEVQRLMKEYERLVYIQEQHDNYYIIFNKPMEETEMLAMIQKSTTLRNMVITAAHELNLRVQLEFEAASKIQGAFRGWSFRKKHIVEPAHK